MGSRFRGEGKTVDHRGPATENGRAVHGASGCGWLPKTAALGVRAPAARAPHVAKARLGDLGPGRGRIRPLALTQKPLSHSAGSGSPNHAGQIFSGVPRLRAGGPCRYVLSSVLWPLAVPGQIKRTLSCLLAGLATQTGTRFAGLWWAPMWPPELLMGQPCR